MDEICERIVDRLLRLKIKALGRVSRRYLVNLVAHLVLVTARVRDAYLSEGVALDIITAELVLRHVAVYCEEMLKVSGKVEVMVVLLGDFDIIYVNKASLEKKDLVSAIVNVDSDNPSLIDDTERFELLLYDIQCLFERSREPNCSSLSINEILFPNLSYIGLPIIAGWLLGYPSLYWSKPGLVSKALNAQNLTKYTLELDSNTLVGGLVIMEFTVPDSVLLGNLELSISIEKEMQLRIGHVKENKYLHYLGYSPSNLQYRKESVFVTGIVL